MSVGLLLSVGPVLCVCVCSNLSGCPLSSLYRTLHVATPFCRRLRARKVQPADRLPQHPGDREKTESKRGFSLNFFEDDMN